MDEDPFNLNPDLLYPVIDATTVKRTRHFIKKYYERPPPQAQGAGLLVLRGHHRLDRGSPGGAVDRDERLAPYRGRIASVAGSELRNGISRKDAVNGFAPESTESDDKLDKFDVLLCTDVLAEGMNLQECRNIINYDLPWNPMRLVQRHGRIDRIGSPHDRVFLRTFSPTTL